MLRTLQSSPHPVFSRTVCASVATAWCSAAPSGRWSVELPITINGRVAEFKVWQTYHSSNGANKN